jgi:menaquinone-dependent protoporphyrinogen oxidase
MEGKVLVAYASKHGSTAMVAEAVAEELHAAGVDADLREVDEVEDVAEYAAVVLGAPLYMGRWRREARRFLGHHRGPLERVPVAIFALGPIEDTPESFASSRVQLLRALGSFEWLAPACVEVFGGAIEPETLHFPFSHMPAADIRDWDAIREWTQRLPDALRIPQAVG